MALVTDPKMPSKGEISEKFVAACQSTDPAKTRTGAAGFGNKG